MYQDNDKNMLAFDSITEMAGWINDNAKYKYDDVNPKFYGNTSWGDMLARCALGYDADWPRFKDCEFRRPNTENYRSRVRELLGMGGDVLYIPAVSSADREFDQMVNRPVEWINTKLSQYGLVSN